jgi:pyrroline-5-carboxylate reductase
VNDQAMVTIFSPNDPLLLFGCGNMGRAMLNGWVNAGHDPASFVVVDPFAKDLPAGITAYADPAAVDTLFRFVVLAIKPQLFENLAIEIERLLAPDALVVSVLAGTRGDTLAAAFPARIIVRLMPNLAASIGRAPLGLWSADSMASRPQVDAMLGSLGETIWIEAEEQMDAVTALAGSGPAFVYRFIDALSNAGVELGLSPDQASKMAMVMVSGAAELAASSDASPGVLAARVTSVGGTTAAGLAVLDANDALQSLVTETLRAARDRGKELSCPGG